MQFSKFLIITVLILSILSIGLLSCKKSSDPWEQQPSYYIGNVNTEVFHRPSCSYLTYPENRITFETRDEAVNAGYRPCQHCEP